MKAKYTEGYVYPLKIPQENLKDLEKIVQRLNCSKADAIRDAIRHYAEYLEGLEVINLRNIPEDRAKKEIQAYLKEKDRVTADRISDDLRLDLSLVNKILLDLWQEGEVEPVE